MSKVEILQTGSIPEKAKAALAEQFAVHTLAPGESLSKLGDAVQSIRGFSRGGHADVDAAMIAALPALEIISNFGVGYDGIDLKAAAARGIIVTNTPDVLTEEVADTALGLLLMTVRELSAAERHLRAGDWEKRSYRLSPATMRNRTVGIAGLGRIGLAIARRLDAMQVPVVYHTRTKRDDVPYRHYGDLKAMASDVDTLMIVLPGSASTHNAVNMDVLKALGPKGIVVNVGRGSVIDEPALIRALKDGTIMAAGLDVFADEPYVPAELKGLPNAVLLPHVGSASVHTRDGMGQLMVDNLSGWFNDKAPLTPVPETPWPR